MPRLMEWWEWLAAATVIALLVSMGWMLYDLSSAETFSLRKDEWACTRNHTTYMPQVVGKATVLMPRTVCDQYERKAG